MENSVIIKDLSKKIKGKTVLSDINLLLERNKIYGFYGINGSGKSMLFRAIAGLIHPTTGSVIVLGEHIGKNGKFPSSMGLVIETVGFWSYYTGLENLKNLASIKRIASDESIKNTLTRVGLDPEDKRIYKKYSLGMQQRLAIAQAIMEKPEMILLDEPSNALDEDGVQLIHTIIREEAERGATILIASHNKDDLSLCDQLFKMTDGMLVEGGVS